MQLKRISLTILTAGVVIASINLVFHHIQQGGPYLDSHDLRTHAPRVRTQAQGAAALIGSKAVDEQASAPGSAGSSSVAPGASKAGPLLITASELAASALHTAGAAAQEAGVLATNAVSLVVDGDPISDGGGASNVQAVIDGVKNGAADLHTGMAGSGSTETDTSGRHPLQQRVCGSPAVDGYANVVDKCLYDSPSARWWSDWKAHKGQVADLEVHIDRNADYDGLAVAWGIGNTKASVEECGEACRMHKPNPKGGGMAPLPCNAFSFCPDDNCWEPDIHKHSKGDCWLKFTEGPASPEVNMRGAIDADVRKRHKNAPETVQWHSGVLLPKGLNMDNGTWSPRHVW